MTIYTIEASCEVEIDVKDPQAITRCTENHTDDGVPAGPDEKGWRDFYYPLETEEEVLHHWTFNCLVNGVEDVRRLDGWADLPEGTVTMEVKRGTVFSCPI